MDNFREWLSDNLRYILLGVAIILVLVLAILGVKLIGGLNDQSNKPDNQTKSSQETETKKESEPESQSETSGITLAENEPSILETVQAYYTARSNKDIETLSAMVENLTEKDQQTILNETVIESYNNIASYSTKGPVEGSYVVYTYYDAKVAGVETLAPGLAGLYVRTRDDGTLYIADSKSDESVKEYITKVNSDPEVQKLLTSVEEKYDKAVESDEALKNIMADFGTPETKPVLPDSSEAGVQANKIVVATDVCNVRADSREDADIIGMLDIGIKVTRVQKLDNGWSEIKYLDATGYVKSEFLTEELEGAADNEP